MKNIKFCFKFLILFLPQFSCQIRMEPFNEYSYSVHTPMYTHYIIRNKPVLLDKMRISTKKNFIILENCQVSVILTGQFLFPPPNESLNSIPYGVFDKPNLHGGQICPPPLVIWLSEDIFNILF